MVSFTSSAINKSGKKFAPKAPARRTGAASTNTVGTVKTGFDTRRPSITPVSETHEPHAASITSEPDTQTSTANAQEVPGRDNVPITEPAERSSVTAGLKQQLPAAATNTAREQSVGNRDERDAIEVSHLPTPLAFGEGTSAAQPKSPESTHNISDEGQTAIIPSKEDTTRTVNLATDSTTVSKNVSEDSYKEGHSIHEHSAIEGEPLISHANTPASVVGNRHGADQLEKTDEPRISTGTNANSGTPRIENTLVTNTARQFQKPRPPQSKRRKSTEADNSSSTGTTRTRKPRAKRKREPTPEESEQVEIAPAVVKMSELCKDLRTGRKSRREVELRNLESAEAERKQKAREKARNPGTPVKADMDNASTTNDEVNTTPSKSQTGPRMRIVNGEIVIDNASLQIDRRAEAAREMGEMEDVVESRLNRKINQATYGKRTKAESWDEDLTDLFYRGLRMFGTDFSLISKMFPGRSRRQIKLKFNNEERRDPERIKQTLLGPHETVDIQTYSELTNTVYEDLEVIQRELEEDKRRIEEQHTREKRAEDELMRNPTSAPQDSNVITSIEGVPPKKRRRSSGS